MPIKDTNGIANSVDLDQAGAAIANKCTSHFSFVTIYPTPWPVVPWHYRDSTEVKARE